MLLGQRGVVWALPIVLALDNLLAGGRASIGDVAWSWVVSSMLAWVGLLTGKMAGLWVRSRLTRIAKDGTLLGDLWNKSADRLLQSPALRRSGR